MPTSLSPSCRYGGAAPTWAASPPQLVASVSIGQLRVKRYFRLRACAVHVIVAVSRGRDLPPSRGSTGRPSNCRGVYTDATNPRCTRKGGGGRNSGGQTSVELQ
jgi:hypothetical protein